MRYGDHDVLTGVDLDVHAGEVVCLLGPNGAGKTTTIEILEGFRIRSAGDVSVFGEDPATAGTPTGPRPFDVEELLGVVDLTELADRKIGTFSGGQRRRLDVAIGIVGRPELLFLDEPTAGFDPQVRRDFHDLVHRLADLDGTTVLLTTHDLDEADKLADRVLILAGGRIVADDSPAGLARRAGGTAEVRWTSGGERFVHATDDAAVFLRGLLGEPGEVVDLEVHRASLEDAYLGLSQQHEAGGVEDAARRFVEVTR